MYSHGTVMVQLWYSHGTVMVQLCTVTLYTYTYTYIWCITVHAMTTENQYHVPVGENVLHLHHVVLATEL